VKCFGSIGRTFGKNTDFTVLIERIRTKILASDITVDIVYECSFGVDHRFLGSSHIDSSAFKKCYCLSIGRYFCGICHTDSDRNSVRYFLREDIQNAFVSEILGVEKNVFFRTCE